MQCGRVKVFALFVWLVGLGTLLAEAQDNKAPDPRAIINDSINALGGKEMLVGLERTYQRSETRMQNVPMMWEVWTDIPTGNNRQRITYEIMGSKNELIVVVNGSKGWVKTNDSETRAMDKEQIAVDDAYSHRTLVRRLYPLLDQKEFEVSFAGDRQCEGRAVHCITVRTGQDKLLELVFDKNSKLLYKTSVQLPDDEPRGKVATQYFSEYRTFDGVKYAVKVTTKIDGKVFMEEELKELRRVKEFPSRTFLKP